MLEIERKFLVKGISFKKEAQSHIHIVQGFLNTAPERTVRIRIKGSEGFITVKGLSNASGTTRFEWEKEISFEEAQNLLPLCEAPLLEKIRYLIPIKGFVFEVDEFVGENTGLVVAELELPHEDTAYPRPSWLGKEVTGDAKYYNSQLIQNPYKNWNP